MSCLYLVCKKIKNKKIFMIIVFKIYKEKYYIMLLNIENNLSILNNTNSPILNICIYIYIYIYI